MMAVLGSLEPQPLPRMLGKVGALWAALFVVNALIPHMPAFVGRDFDPHGANWWEYLHARYGARATAAIDETQTKLLQTELAALKP